MRSFSFRAKNIGKERYLTYIMGEGCELDEDILDYCEEKNLKELIKVIYEEDDDYDYLTYDITGKMTLEKCVSGVMDKEKVFKLLRNIALGLVSCKEQAIHLSYLLLNKGFMYVNPDTLSVQFICLPIESEGSVAAEFKGFIRQLLANLKYNVEEDLSYVGQLLTYINGDGFNLRGLIGLTEALMEDSGIEYEEEGAIATDDGSEVVNIISDEEAAEEPVKVNGFMDDLDAAEDVLPEIGDDEDDLEEDDVTEEAETLEPKAEEAKAEEPKVEEAKAEETKTEDTKAEAPKTEEPKPEDVKETPIEAKSDSDISETSVSGKDEETERTPLSKEEKQNEQKITASAVQPANGKPESIEEIKARLERIVNGEQAKKDSINSLEELDELFVNRPVVKKNTIKVNRAAIIQNAVEQEQDESKEETEAQPEVVEEIAKGSKKANEKKESVIEEINDSLNSEASAAVQSKQESSVRPIKSGSILSKGSVSVNNAVLGVTGALKICPYLIRTNTGERVMITKAVFKIGKASRGVDYTVDGNGAISRQHAVISQREGVYYIKDNKSTNHTYVNGKKVEDGQEEILTHDCKVKLGDEEFLFKIR